MRTIKAQDVVTGMKIFLKVSNRLQFYPVLSVTSIADGKGIRIFTPSPTSDDQVESDYPLDFPVKVNDAAVKVRDLKVGDLVDLEGDEILGHHVETAYEYSEVIEIDQEKPDLIVLYFNGMAAGYDPDKVMIIKTREE